MDALRRYEQVFCQQHEEVSKIMMSSAPKSSAPKSSGQELAARKPSVPQPSFAPGGSSIGRILGNLTNCTCTLGNQIANINAPMQQSMEEEFDEITKDMDLDLH